MTKGFSKLPLELWLMIYEDLLICPDPIYDPLPELAIICQCPSTDPSQSRWYQTSFYCPGWAYMHRRVQGHETRQLHPAILAVNKQIYFEAIHILYSKNRFQFPWSSPYHEAHEPSFWKIGPALVALIRHVRFSFYQPAMFDCLGDAPPRDNTLVELQKVCPNVTALELVNDGLAKGWRWGAFNLQSTGVEVRAAITIIC